MKLRSIDPRLAAAMWIGLIYATIPFVRRVRELFVAHLPAEIIGYAVMVVVIVSAGAAIRFLRRTRRRISGRDVAWLGGVAVVFVLWTLRLMGQPEEAIHFLEYGLLGVLLYRALDARVPDRSIFLVVTAAGLLVGTVDEIIQWLVPGRYWDFRDIVLNGGAVLLSQVAVWRLTRRPPAPVRKSSLRLVCRLAAAELLLLTICLAATPQRLSMIAEHFPLPERLATGVDAICEYGFRHTVDASTAFRSRLPVEDLARIDRQRAIAVAAELDAAKGKGALSRSAVSPVDDPFGYEIRVHIFSRNRNLQKGLALAPGAPERRPHMTTAWRQNLILEHSFGNTLESSSFRWEARRRAEVEKAQDPAEVFVSRAGEHLITRVGELRLRMLMLALFALLVACDVLLATRSRPAAPPE